MRIVVLGLLQDASAMRATQCVREIQAPDSPCIAYFIAFRISRYEYPAFTHVSILRYSHHQLPVNFTLLLIICSFKEGGSPGSHELVSSGATWS